MKTFVLILIDQ